MPRSYNFRYTPLPKNLEFIAMDENSEYSIEELQKNNKSRNMCIHNAHKLLDYEEY